MKNFAIICAALLVAGIATAASAGEHVSVSKSTLASMGFGSASVMSDADGAAVRGKGYQHSSHSSVTTSASVSGTSTASFHGTTSSNQYAASSSHSNSGGASAVGSSLSFAGTISGGANNHGFLVSGTLVVSGGGASASAH
jgi:hypothetical protein